VKSVDENDELSSVYRSLSRCAGTASLCKLPPGIRAIRARSLSRARRDGSPPLLYLPTDTDQYC